MKSADVRHDWTRDAYINSALAHIIESEPELGKPLERKSGLELLDPKSGRAIPLQSLHLLDTHKFAQLWAIDSVYCDVIATDIEALWEKMLPMPLTQRDMSGLQTGWTTPGLNAVEKHPMPMRRDIAILKRC